MNYPYLSNRKIDSAISKVIKERIDGFRKDALAPKVNPDWKYELWVDYQATHFSKGIICFKFESYEFTGGAHGTTTVITRIYDLDSGKEYKFRDVFRNGREAAKLISEIAVPKIKARLGKDADMKWINEGAGPSEKNFRNFILTGKALLIYFSQYQVAPYSSGIQEISIPLKQLEPLLKPPFR